MRGLETLQALGRALGIALGGVVFLASWSLALGTMSGVVREHCLDADETVSAKDIRVDSHWTYIIWPPIFLSSVDPYGRCVRNAPIHEALSAIGVWELLAPQEQVRRHVVAQIFDTAADRASERAYLKELEEIGDEAGAALSKTGQPDSVEEIREFLPLFEHSQHQYEALKPPTSLVKEHERFIRSMRKMERLIRQLLVAADTGDRVRANQLSIQAGALEKEMNRALLRLFKRAGVSLE